MQIVFAKKSTQIVMRSKVIDSGETVDRNFSFLKAYLVFNAEQIDKLPAQFGTPGSLSRYLKEDWPCAPW